MAANAMPVSIVKVLRQLSPSFSLAAVFLLGTGGFLFAQAPDYRPPPPPKNNTSLELRMRFLFSPDVEFRGLGTVPLSTDNVSANNPLLGTEREIRYDDGDLRQDYISSDLVAGGEAAEGRIPSPNDEATSNFIYFSPQQLDPEDPSALLFHRYAAVGNADQTLSAESDSSLGWEINYTKYLKWNRNLGIQVGFSFNGFDSRFNDKVGADLFVQEFRHRMAGDADVPDLPGSGENAAGSDRQEPFVGTETREEVEATNLLEWAATQETEELIPEGAVVDTEADLRSSIYSLRAGPVYSLSPEEGFARKFALRVGAGVSALYYSGEFATYQILENPTGGPNPSQGLTSTSEAAWQLAGYLDASAEYQFTQRVSIFSGMQLQSGSDYEQENRQSEANVDFQSQVYVHAGFGIRF